MIGFHVELKDGWQEFLNLLVQANVKTVKLQIPLDVHSADVVQACDFIYRNKMEAYVSIFDVRQEEVQHDPIYKYMLKRDWLFGRYNDVLRWISRSEYPHIIGISLIENAHRLVRTKEYGFSRREVREVQQRIVEVIGGRFPTVLQCREEDLKADHWKGVDCDIYDLKGTTTPKSHDKPVWVSGIRVEKGSVIKSQQEKVLKAAQMCRAERTFIYSRDADGFRWGSVIRGRDFSEKSIRSYKAE